MILFSVVSCLVCMKGGCWVMLCSFGVLKVFFRLVLFVVMKCSFL